MAKAKAKGGLAPAATEHGAAVQVPVPFDTLVAVVRQLDREQLQALCRVAEETLAERTPAPGGTPDTDAEAERQAAIARSRATWEQSLAAQPEINAAIRQLRAAWGLDQIEPVPVEELREMMRREGIREEDNSFSREIIAMREE